MTSRRYLRIRWAADRIVAAGAVVLLAPVLAVTAVLIVLTSGSPSLVALPRVGQGGRVFQQYKFRTMRAAAPGPTITPGDDPRVTAVGRLLRAYRLDELPQLVNVVLGQMALVGPRPETPDMVDVDDLRWSEVLAAKPGIAGAAQAVVAPLEARLLLGGGASTVYRTIVLPTKLDVDRWYLRHVSPRLDLAVLRACVSAVTRSGQRQPASVRFASLGTIARRPGDEPIGRALAELDERAVADGIER